jgi:hypothetical protein
MRRRFNENMGRLAYRLLGLSPGARTPAEPADSPWLAG